MSQSAKHADINDIGELVTRARQFREEGHWIFRGAPKAFDLQPTIGRDIREELNGSGASYSLKQEQQLFDHFLRRSKPYPTHKPEWVLSSLRLLSTTASTRAYAIGLRAYL